jgi:peptidyl-prolyl cis-trans isomerase D
LLKQLRADPAKFAELAKAKSQDPGLLPMVVIWVLCPWAMVKPFDDVVFRMQPARSAKWWKPNMAITSSSWMR